LQIKFSFTIIAGVVFIRKEFKMKIMKGCLPLNCCLLLVLSAFSSCFSRGLEPDPYNTTEVQVKDFENKLCISKERSVLWKFRDFKPNFELHFVVIIPSYCNSKWYKKNLDSIFMQKYENYNIIYIDDASPDGTGHLVEEYVKQRQQSHRVTVIKNEKRACSLANIYKAVYMCDDSWIVASCDGDDWWCNEHVLETLNKIYQATDTWVTYGNLMHVPGNKVIAKTSVPKRIIDANSFRSYIWNYSGLRTYPVWLFKKIKLEDLLYEGNFIASHGDGAYFFPLLEMAGKRQFLIQDIFYVANRATGLNDFLHRSFQADMEKVVKNKIKYKPLH
jgi:glycosyltransferase involved in cell wall biosynthesis